MESARKLAISLLGIAVRVIVCVHDIPYIGAYRVSGFRGLGV